MPLLGISLSILNTDTESKTDTTVVCDKENMKVRIAL